LNPGKIQYDVCIPSLSVSGRHARVVFEDDSAWLEDLQSTNGTYFNGLLIRRHPLRDGDEVILGKIRIRFANLYEREMDSNSDLFTSSLDDPGPLERAQVAGPASGSSAPPAGRNGTRGPSTPDLSSPGLSASQLNEHPTQTLTQKVSEPRNTDSRSQSSPPREQNAHPLEGLGAPQTSRPTHELDVEHAANPSQGAVIEIKNGAKSGQILPIDKPVTTLGRPGIQIAAIMRKPDGYFLMHIESDDSMDRPTLNLDRIGDEPVMLQSGDRLNVAGIDVEFMLS